MSTKRIESFPTGTKPTAANGMLSNQKRTELALPQGARIVGSARQDGRYRILAEVPVAEGDAALPLETRLFMLVGQGEAIPDFWHYLCQVAPEAGTPPTYLYEIPTDDI